MQIIHFFAVNTIILLRQPDGETLLPPGGDLTPTFSETLMSPLFKTARLRKKKRGPRGRNGPLKVEKMPKI